MILGAMLEIVKPVLLLVLTMLCVFKLVTVYTARPCFLSPTEDNRGPVLGLHRRTSRTIIPVKLFFAIFKIIASFLCRTPRIRLLDYTRSYHGTSKNNHVRVLNFKYNFCLFSVPIDGVGCRLNRAIIVFGRFNR